MTPTDELMALLRGLVQRGVVHRVDDTGPNQAADVETAEGILRSAAQVLQLPGLACNPGTDGVMALVLAPGGDQGIPLVIITATGAGIGNLASGESVVYALDGSARAHFKPGGEIHVMATTKATVEAPEVDIVATTKAKIASPLVELGQAGAVVNVLGTLKVNGVTMNVP